MPVYLVIEIEVHDSATYAEYKRRVPETIAAYGGRYRVRGGPVIPLDGDWNPERVVILEFPTFEQLQQWNTSPEYREVVPLRERSATTRSIVLEGFESVP